VDGGWICFDEFFSRFEIVLRAFASIHQLICIIGTVGCMFAKRKHTSTDRLPLSTHLFFCKENGCVVIGNNIVGGRTGFSDSLAFSKALSMEMSITKVKAIITSWRTDHILRRFLLTELLDFLVQNARSRCTGVSRLFASF
jgi:hypothetical protein